MTKTKVKRPPKPKAEKTPKPKAGIFAAGDQVEFHFTESADGVRPQGDANVLQVEQVTAKQKMYLLEVTQVVAGNPDALRNPSGELWAQDGELFKAGTRHAVALRETGAEVIAEQVKSEHEPPREKKPALGLPEGFRKLKEQTKGALLLFRNGPLYEAFNGDATVAAVVLGIPLWHREEVAYIPITKGSLPNAKKKLVAAGHRVGMCEVASDGPGHQCKAVIEDTEVQPETPAGAPLNHEAAIAAACVVLFEETGRHCNIIQLAGKKKQSARKQIVSRLLGREAAFNELGVFNIRDLFREALGIEQKLTGEEADERIAERAKEIVAAMDDKELAAAVDAGVVIEESKPSEEPSTEPSAAGAGEATQTIPATESEPAMAATKTKKNRTVHLAFGEHGAGPVIRALRKEGVAAEHLPVIMKGLGFKITDAYIAMKFKQKNGKAAADLNATNWAAIKKLCPPAFKK